MPFIRRRFFGALLLCGLLPLCCPSAHSQANQQQAADINIMQQPAYLQAMNDCVQKLVNPAFQPGGQRVDPRTFRIAGDKFQIIRKCMAEKGVPVPDVQRYSQTGDASRNALPPVAPQEAPVAPPAEAPPAEAPPAAPSPEAQDGEAAAPPPAAPPPIYNASPAGNDNNGAKPLWVVPQSQ